MYLTAFITSIKAADPNMIYADLVCFFKRASTPIKTNRSATSTWREVKRKSLWLYNEYTHSIKATHEMNNFEALSKESLLEKVFLFKSLTRYALSLERLRE